MDKKRFYHEVHEEHEAATPKKDLPSLIFLHVLHALHGSLAFPAFDPIRLQPFSRAGHTNASSFIKTCLSNFTKVWPPAGPPEALSRI
ncbi:hypothetical protein [Desulfoluna limicola]|uniref:hypothetical protein n=1 Tax=Desulfoluna limicola TaxID=2810562 RepID=UPI001F46C21D|nr:hypothetical protein [Desulfoluna limicola]